MKTEKYRDFKSGEIRQCYVLNIDDDSGVALLYVLPYDKSEIGCFEFGAFRSNQSLGKHWTSTKKENYSNIGSVPTIFKKFLKGLKQKKQNKQKKGRSYV